MQDLRDAIRALKATPMVSAVAILSLALGIGANTAIFSILDSLLVRTLPVVEPRQLALLGEGTDTNRSWTNPIWEQIREHRDLFGGAFAWSGTRFNLAQGGQTEFVDGIWASGRYFEVLGVPAVLGRTFTAEDDRRGGGPDGPVTVISYGFWQRRFGGAPDVVGRSLTIERVPHTIVGVTGPAFFGTEVGRTFDVAIPLGTEPLIRGKESSLDRRSYWWLNVMIRLKAGQTTEAATRALRGIQPQIRDATMPEQYRPEDRVQYLNEGLSLDPAGTGSSGLRRRYERPLLTIMVVVALVLLVACANIANLLLARATARRHEMSVRLALGASRARLWRQLLAESLVLSALGATAGLVFAHWGSRLLVRQLSTSANTVFLDLSIDWRVLAFTAAATIVTAVLFGTAPAFRASRVQPNEALKEKGRGIAGEGRFAAGNLLVVAQVALSLILVVAAGLFMRSFNTLMNLDLGFERDPVLVVRVDAQRLQLDPPQRPELFERFRAAATGIPGTAAAALSAVTPISGSSWQFGVEAVDGVPLPRDNRAQSVFVNLISPDWFATYGTRLLAGRDFTAADMSRASRVTIVNEAFARKFLAGRNPIGHRISQGGPPGEPAPELEIVGYVEDAVYRSLREGVPPTMYLPIGQHPQTPSSLSLSIRAAGGSPSLLIRSAAQTLNAVHRDVALTFRALGEQVNSSLIQDRLVAILSGFFGALALLLAALGLYGVTSYAVSRQRTEIGIRMALGAAPGGVVRMVLVRVGVLVGLGVLVGGSVSLWAAQFVSALLYGLQPRDPVTMAGAIVALAIIGMLAGFVPARRASRIDPARVLRDG